MKLTRILPVILAGVLQVMPMLRAVLPLQAQAIAPFSWTFVLKLATGAVALLGSYHAVSAASTIVPNGTNYNLTAGTAWGGQTLTYNGGHAPKSWNLYSGSLPPGITFFNGASYATLTGTPTTAGAYSCVIRTWENANLSGSYAAATFTFNVAAGNTPPSITGPPTNRTVAVGANVTNRITAIGATPLSYQWRFNGTNIPGATTTNLVFNNIQLTNTGPYSVVVSNAYGTASTNFTLTVLIPPSFPVPMASQTVLPGANVTFSAAATGATPLSYQWQTNGVNIAGATATNLVLNNVQTTATATYSLIASNAVGKATNAATLTVVEAPAIALQPTSKIVTEGTNVTFTVFATGNPLAYQWRWNSNTVAWASGASLTLSNVTAVQSGFYSVVVTNLAGSATSADARLLVVPPPTPSVSPTFRPLNLSGIQFTLSYTTTPGFRHLLQYNNALGDTNWVTMVNTAPSFNVTTINFPQRTTNAPQRFYRVLVLQQ